MSDSKLTIRDPGGANFRAGPGISKPKLLEKPLLQGSPVWATGAPDVEAEGHTWREVALGPVGYVAVELLSDPAEAEVVPPSGTRIPTADPLYNPDLPVSTQEYDWDCAQDSTWEALRMMGRQPSNQWMEDEMLKAGVESTELGLTDASGEGLAAWIREQYEPDLTAYAVPSLSYDDAVALAGRTGFVAGARNWNGPGRGHWVAVRRARDGALELANPAGQFSRNYGQQTMDREGWEQRGPWSGVVIERRS